jgi:hypothetical protein
MTIQGMNQRVCRRQVDPSWQVFFFDRNGARVKLDFAAPRSA